MRNMISIAVAVIVSCATVPPPKPLERPATCADMCARGTELGCEWAKPTPRGKTCLDVCRNVMDSGVLTFDLECEAKASSCGVCDR